MKKLILIFGTSFLFIVSFAQSQGIPVFVSGEDGHKSYRIPAIIGLPNGELIAFCEGRVGGSDDYGDINIVMKKSKDKGKTWANMQTIVDYEKLQAGNPAPVVDLTDPAYPKGRIFLFYNTGNNHESEVRKGKGLREVWYKTSVDNGATWSEAVNITLQTHRPRQPEVNPAYNFNEDWRSYANTPGHAMQFQSGKYRGRIYVAANHSAGEPQPRYAEGRAFGYFSDDHGKTFRISNDIQMPGGNEATAAELSGNRLMMNVRNQKGDVKARIIATSSNGGEKWDTAYFDKNLPDPVCEGSILTIGKKGKKNILAFCNAADTTRRDNLVLRISFDDGKTWNKNITVDNHGKDRNNAAYSDIVKTSDQKIGILYEKDNYTRIVFTEVKWK